MESVSFDTLTFDHPAACRPARLSASLHLPASAERPTTPITRPRAGSAQSSGGSLYALLLRQIKGADLLERRPGYHVRRIAVTAVLLAGGWTAFVLLGDSWWQLAVAAFLAFVFTQVGFIDHEAPSAGGVVGRPPGRVGYPTG